eukprot:g1647.t1
MADLEEPSSKKNYRKDKPWDNDTIDHWAIQEWKEGDMIRGPLAEESSFATLFPQYREHYLKEIWPALTRHLKKVGIACELDLVEGSMTVKTTRRTHDPYIILKARDLIKLLARSIPLQQAIKILQDDVHCDIVKIGGLVRNKERFVKRRQRLVGPNGSTLKAIELLSNCYILVQGQTASVMGGFKGLKQVRRIIIDCMNNIHPIYHIKTMMIKRELAKDPEMQNENWDRFLPKFKSKNVKRKKKTGKKDRDAQGLPMRKSKKKKSAYTPFPPTNHQMPSKLDLQMESGEFFQSEKERKERKKAEKRELAANKKMSKHAKRMQEFVPVANAKAAAKKRKATEAITTETKKKKAKTSDIEKLKKKFKKRRLALAET